MTERLKTALLLTLFLVLIPTTVVFAEDNGESTTTLLETPFVIVGFVTLGLLIYYSIRES
ncbi:hypothetical protein [Salisediminibacterium beveridgei]|uniref:Uncharacterized protein n=1 Tax=Salisediminibacterium beveridgei TaxID=632773 RepID=A0A1D7QVQ8_9BACI|nr:hypothetical protein [Salisediminibacterium beveridgei]AOM83048.1 hypothetical protein BBEV_1687 [Salisediminibacterium beveridgei]